MALDDLVRSMENFADFMDMTFLKEIGDRIRELGKSIEDSKGKGQSDVLQKHITEVCGHFKGWGGGLYDILFCKANYNIPDGMTEEYANRVFRELLDDLFFNVLFWDTDKVQALKTYQEMIILYNKTNEEKDSRFRKDNPELMKEHPLPIREPLPIGLYYSKDPGWFREWTDLGKLPADP
ncbi:MAG: hypothetical protein MUO81_09915 [Thermoplasmata archaeon]|nr:hypothetical protein [Thermoplasmata archaeon]